MRRLILLVVGFMAAVAFAQDLQSGRDVYGPCAACHGASAEGGKQGEYPRLAGQPAEYLVAQLKAFQARARFNLPMLPYTEPRELSEGDMRDVAAYLAAIELPTKPPVFKDTDSALFRLEAMANVLVVPRVEGDVAAGKKLYKRKCVSCHGRDAKGKAHPVAPRLVGQYPDYLRRQVAAYLRGDRAHDEEAGAGVLTKLKPGEFENVLAWLTSIQEGEEASAPDSAGE